MREQREVPLHELPFYETPGAPESVRAAGPSIGPMHGGAIPPPPDLRKGVPPGAVVSPLAITLRGLRSSRRALTKVSQIVVHMTGQGPAGKSKKAGYKRPAVEFALDWYLNGGPNGGFPHYVIDFPGTIYATSDERNVAYHAGWVHPGGAGLFRSAGWRAPDWWRAVWGRYGFDSPLQLLPAGAKGPNSRSIGIELMITSDLKFTDAQYRALARLILDIEQRHGLSIPAAPSPVLLGHEDYAPTGRSDKGGGWDPGAHRTSPRFSWSKLWSYMRGGSSANTVVIVPTASKPAPVQAPAQPGAFRKFRLTHYYVADQRDHPTGAIRVPILGANGSKIAEASPAFFAQLSLEGSGRLSDGRLINVTGKSVPVSHADYAAVLAHHRQAYAKGDRKRRAEGKAPAPTAYSGITTDSSDRVTHALAFHEVPAAKRGVGYGMLRGIPLVPFRTLAADLGLKARSEPAWKGKGGLVPAGTRVYVKEYDGLRLPDGTTHDGWFVVNDTGGAIFGAHFDVFTGTRSLARQVKLPSVGQVSFSGIEQRIPQGYSYGLTG
jgi:hypothetical protein